MQEGFDTLKAELDQLQKSAEILWEEHRTTIDLLLELGSMYQRSMVALNKSHKEWMVLQEEVRNLKAGYSTMA